MGSLSKEEINHIRVSAGRCSVQGLANELGRAKETVEQKLQEIEANRRVRKMVSDKKHYVKRKIHGGM